MSTGDIQSTSIGSLSDFLAKHRKGIAYFCRMSVLLKLSNPSCVYFQALATRSSVEEMERRLIGSFPHSDDRIRDRSTLTLFEVLELATIES